jgi:hypothetical protein
MLWRCGSSWRWASAVSVAGALLAVAAWGGAGAALQGSAGSVASFAARSLNPLVPASVTASRLNASTCRVSWTASTAPDPPVGLTYDVTDGSTTLVSGVAGLVVDLSTTQNITPAVRARAGNWVSASATTSSVSCAGAPGAPTAVVPTAAQGQISVVWSAAPANGSTITGYTVTGTPSTGSPVTCTATVPASGCALTGLTDGVLHTITVTATNQWGTGPASTSVSATRTRPRS